MDVSLLTGGYRTQDMTRRGLTEDEERRSPYVARNFSGLEKELVETISTWIKALLTSSEGAWMFGVLDVWSS